MSNARLALRLLSRDWRAGELRLLAAAVVVAVAAVSSVTWLAERVGGATGGRAAELLGADRAVQTAEPIPADWLSRAHALGLRTTRTAEFPSVVLAGDRTQLVSVKAVERGYPLRGQLQLMDAVGAPIRGVDEAPPSGAAWVEPRLLGPLALEVGQRLTLGQVQFRIQQLIALEPDRGGFFSSLAPRLMMHYGDLEATGLIQPASRVRYQLLLAGDERQLEAFRRWLEPEERRGVEWRTPESANTGVQEVIGRAKRFLGLSALLTVVIAGVGMLLTVRRYAARQIDRVAVMRCLGATQAQVTALLTWKLVWLGLFAGGTGIALGFGLHALMLGLVAELLPAAVPPPGWLPAVSGAVTAFASLLGFALPTVLRLKRVPPLRVLRRELGSGVLRGGSLYLLAVLVIFALMWWQARDPRLALLVGAAVLAALALLGAMAWLLVWGLRRLRAGRQRLLWLSGLTRRPGTAAVQIVAVGVGLMALFLLTLVRQDLLVAWQDRIPPDAPNYFLINVQPEEVARVRQFLDAQGGIEPRFYPMIRGRLTGINGREIAPGDFEGRAERLLSREFNLSYGTAMSPDNRLVAGEWWDQAPAEPDQFSVETGIAEELGIDLGDRLTFLVGGEEVSATVSNLRRVEWDSFNVNFFVIAPPGLLEPYPTTFITSFYLPAERQGAMTGLVREFPSVTVFDINGILRTVRAIIDQGASVVELMASLTLVAGVIVLLAALQITGEERRFESALLRALGASRGRIRRLARLEFWLLGAMAGALAGGIATVSGGVLARQLFDLDYPANPWLLPLGALAGALIVWVAGGWGTRRFYRGSPMQLLRDPAEP